MATRKSTVPAEVTKKPAPVRRHAKARAKPEPADEEKGPVARKRAATAGRIDRKTLAAEMAELADVTPAEEAQTRVSVEVRVQMIRDAAYFIAESRGFGWGDPAADWLEAEKQVDAQLGKGKPRTKRARS